MRPNTKTIAIALIGGMLIAPACLLLMEQPDAGIGDQGTDGDDDIMPDDDDFSDDDSSGSDDDVILECYMKTLAVYEHNEDIDEIIAHDQYLYILGGNEMYTSANEIAVVELNGTDKPFLVSRNDKDISEAYGFAYHLGRLLTLEREYSFPEGEFSYLMVFDVETPSETPAVCEKQEMPFFATQMVVKGDRAYIGGRDGEADEGVVHFAVYDLADPDNPEQMSMLTFMDGRVTAIAVADDRVYLACQASDLVETVSIEIIDVSDPKAPEKIGQDTSLSFSIAAMAVKGGYLFAATEYDFYVFSIENGAKIDLLSSYDVDERISSIVVDKEIAYASSYEKIFALDVSSPDDVQLFGEAYSYEGFGCLDLDNWDAKLLFGASAASTDPMVEIMTRCHQP